MSNIASTTNTRSVADAVKLHFLDRLQKITVDAELGKTLLDVCRKNNIDLEGACEGSLACSTCHVILDENTYKKLGEPTDREYDLLDQAFGATLTSRLGCQIRVSKNIKDAYIRLAEGTRNLAVDGYKPKH